MKFRYRNECWLVILAVLLGVAGGCERRSNSTQSSLSADSEMHPILKQLSTLPDEIIVTHSPNPVKAQPGGRSGYKYTWLYETKVAARTGQVVIEEFGSFTWHNNQWFFVNFTMKPFTASDFAEWYECPNAKLNVGQAYSDGSNWTGGDVLASGKMKWYFIGRNEKGERVKGEAIIETLPQAE